MSVHELLAAEDEPLEELVHQEGDEEVQYIMLELPTAVPGDLVLPGKGISLLDMDTEQPQIVLEGGLQLQGSYEDNLGTLMLFEHQQPGGDGQATAEAEQQQQQQQQQQQGGQQGQGHVTEVQREHCSFRGMTETKVTVSNASVTAALYKLKQQQRGLGAKGVSGVSQGSAAGPAQDEPVAAREGHASFGEAALDSQPPQHRD